MTIDPRQLLRRLEPAVRPAGPSAARGRASVADATDSGGFMELLSLAREGELESSRTLELADGATLEPATLAQIGRALDLAEARGSQRAVVVAEGRMFLAEVSARRLERLETRDEFVFEEVDAAIAIRGESATFAQRPMGPRALPPREIAEQFEHLSLDATRLQRVSA